MTEDTRTPQDSPAQQDDNANEAGQGEYRRRLDSLQKQFDARNDELATAEAQRDEANMQLAAMENRLAAERLLAEAGAVDIETASLLLGGRVSFNDDIAPETLARSVRQLLADKPFLRGAAGGVMPSLTSSARDGRDGTAINLSATAERAAKSGNRRDVAEYLRLRRQQANSSTP